MNGTATGSVVRGLRAGAALVLALGVLSATAAAQFQFTDQQSGWVLKPKQVEVGGAFTSVTINYGSGEGSDHLANIYGLNLGFGLFKNVELRVRYGYLDPEGGDSGVSVISFGPKIGLWKDRLAVIVPVEFMTGKDVDTAETWNIQPGLIASIPVGQRFEITPSAKALIQVGSDPYNENETFIAVNLGLGLFATADRSVVIRPEIGLLFHPGDPGSFFQFGIGISYCSKAKS